MSKRNRSNEQRRITDQMGGMANFVELQRLRDRQKLKPIAECPETEEFILLEYDKSEESYSMVEIHNKDTLAHENIRSGNNFKYYFIPIPDTEGL